ncbi:hypothetical protein EV651_11255 [Kribbella sp. VKM Ac-2571]|nr:hypothetical protein [Kribbella sp. VKM Ac-2571]TDO56668.1 hypothetical protein EV651_11255 [Kribbella sp. VKM Ac-2571]
MTKQLGLFDGDDNELNRVSDRMIRGPEVFCVVAGLLYIAMMVLLFKVAPYRPASPFGDPRQHIRRIDLQDAEVRSPFADLGRKFDAGVTGAVDAYE